MMSGERVSDDAERAGTRQVAQDLEMQAKELRNIK